MPTRVFRIGLLGCLLAGCTGTGPVVVVSQQPDASAWWTRLTIEPHGKDIRGIPASSLNPAWCEVTELTHQLFAQVPAQSGPWHPAAPEMRYSLDGLVIAGTPASAVLLAYQTCAGSAGTAVVVVSRNAGPASVLAVEQVANRAVWSELSLLSPASFSVSDCRQCDGWTTYTWDSSARKFHAEPSAF